jgi:heterotetrameric sarcosine oxidase gamma subunit
MNAHATPPWGMEPTGMRGAAHATPTVNAAWLRGARCITITPFREQQAACAAWLAQNFDLAWPKAGRIVVKGDLAAAWNGPGDIMLIDAKGNVSIDQILSALAGKAAIVDQSSGRIVIRLAGEKARRTLMKLVDIDIDPTVFKPGMGGITALHRYAGVGQRLINLDFDTGLSLGEDPNYANARSGSGDWRGADRMFYPLSSCKKRMDR